MGEFRVDIEPELSEETRLGRFDIQEEQGD
jgi:hypothetical protein